MTRAGAVLYAKDLDRVVAFYSAVLGFATVGRDEGHVLLESSTLQLAILRIPSHLASEIPMAAPPERRERAAVKLVFWVPSIAEVRASARAWGGALNDAGAEWMFNGAKVCDGVDPEGNVIQIRERAPGP